MGRRSFWYNLTKGKESNISFDNILEILNSHNNAPFEERGESIDTCYLFQHEYQDGSIIEWLYFSSGGGDWVTEEYFDNNYSDFYKDVIRLGEFEELNEENSGWTSWNIDNNYSDLLENTYL